jgi:hypothetical protein
VIDWTPGRIAELRALWADPSLSVTAGAALMGVTKGQFCGKAFRLQLGNKPGGAARLPTQLASYHAPVTPPLAPVAQGRACLWPMWPDATGVPAPARFCGQPRYDGARTPYCREHYRKSVAAPWRGRAA